ncbi:asparagine synthase-related protein [Nonomuraea endophytica]|uniref:asparagine synthase-related protein n=1 Tax=Nonomuraea endophytica TaxID=714136 RepID=UPI0037CB417D
MPGSRAPWFVVLPDVEDARALARALRRIHPRLDELSHPSGRPWLLGDWGGRPPAVGRAGDRAIAAFGPHTLTDRELSAYASRVTTVHDLDALPLCGARHLVATIGGRVRVQGMASGLRRVYWCTAGGMPVAGDRANVLAGLIGSAIDPARLAIRLLYSVAPWPLAWKSLWRGVHAVLPGHYLRMDGRATPTETRWWTPPVPGLPVSQAAEPFREALADAVAGWITPGRPAVSELSGLDSSSICALAVRAGADVLALTAAQPDVMDEDVRWARESVAGLREAGYRLDHDIIPAEDSPLVYDGILSACGDFDEPFPCVHSQRRFEYGLSRGARHSPRVHLSGFGGDEMLRRASPWLLTLLGREPLVGLRHLRATVGRHKWSHVQAIRRMIGERAYPAWLRATATGLEHPSDGMSHVGWGAHPVLPQWVTPDAVAMVRDALLDAADEPQLLSDDLGMHSLLAGTYVSAQEKRCFEQIGDQEGATVAMPFFDDRVFTASLAVRPADRNDPGRYKPLLVEAMRGVVPAAVLGRVTKSGTAATTVMGSRRHRDQLVGLAEGSRLAALGLVDPLALGRVVRGPIDIETPRLRIEPTLGCEIWLRNLADDEDIRAGYGEFSRRS